MLLLLALILSVLTKPLLLTPLIEQGKYEEARNLSFSKYQGFNLGYSAFMTVSSKEKRRLNNMYFWFQPCTNGCDPSTTPFIIWMQGGPGGPSTFGAMSEIGQFWVDADLNLQKRTYSWCEEYNCLFVDQPIQTGFSYQTDEQGHFDPDHIEYTATSPDAMSQIYDVLTQFFKVWSEYKPAPFYISGESYSGLYTANLGWVIHQENQKLPKVDRINFAGLAVGDPIINAKYQWPTYPNTLYGMGVIMTDEREHLKEVFKNGVDNLEKDCWTAFKYWNSVWADDCGGKPGLFYDYTGSPMTENVLLGHEPAAFDNSFLFFNKTDVRVAMHFDGVPSEGHAEGGEVYHTMVKSGDFCHNSSWIYARLFLDVGIDLMIYSTTMDPLLGPPTTEAGVQAVLDYAEENVDYGKEAKADFKNSDKVIWKVNHKTEDVVGYAKCITKRGASNRFCYTVVRNGGHETPAFIPRASYDLIKRFIERRPWTAAGDDPKTPTDPECEGVPPFAGLAIPACNK